MDFIATLWRTHSDCTLGTIVMYGIACFTLGISYVKLCNITRKGKYAKSV
jgi:hypothetical protein